MVLSVHGVEQWYSTSVLRRGEMGNWQQGWLLARRSIGGKIPLDCSLPAESDKDEAATKDRMVGSTVVPKQVTPALISLLANYGSASDSEPEGAYE